MAITIPAPEDIGPAPSLGKREAIWPPRAECVVAAIKAACAETGAHHTAVFNGDTDEKSDRSFPISRARAYAAMAIRAVFEEPRRTSDIGRLVGSRIPGQYLAQLDTRLRNGDLQWFDNAAFMRVVAATEEAV